MERNTVRNITSQDQPKNPDEAIRQVAYSSEWSWEPSVAWDSGILPSSAKRITYIPKIRIFKTPDFKPPHEILISKKSTDFWKNMFCPLLLGLLSNYLPHVTSCAPWEVGGPWLICISWPWFSGCLIGSKTLIRIYHPCHLKLDHSGSLGLFQVLPVLFYLD